MNKYQQIINKLKDTKNNDELFILLNAYINEKLLFSVKEKVYG